MQGKPSKSLSPAGAGISAIETHPGWRLNLGDVIPLSSRQGRGGAKPEHCRVYRLHPQTALLLGPVSPAPSWPWLAGQPIWKPGAAAEQEERRRRVMQSHPLQKAGTGQDCVYLGLSSTISTLFPNFT